MAQLTINVGVERSRRSLRRLLPILGGLLLLSLPILQILLRQLLPLRVTKTHLMGPRYGVAAVLLVHQFVDERHTFRRSDLWRVDPPVLRTWWLRSLLAGLRDHRCPSVDIAASPVILDDRLHQVIVARLSAASHPIIAAVPPGASHSAR